MVNTTAHEANVTKHMGGYNESLFRCALGNSQADAYNCMAHTNIV